MLFFWKGLIVGLLAWGMVSFPLGAMADTGAYTVTPELPRDNAAATSYFKFKVTPGQQRRLRLKLTNMGAQAATYTATLKIATTNANGNLDYSQNNFNSKLPAQANALFTPNRAQSVSVPAKTARWVSFHFTAPQHKFKGIMLAGFTVRPQKVAQATPKQSGIVATTEYAVALEFYNQQPTAQLVPKLTFEWAKYRLAQAHPQMTVHITNHAASLASQGDLTAQLKTKTGQAVTAFRRHQLLFAPQSSFGLNLDLTQHPLKAGEYILSGQLRNRGGQISSFRLPVTVTPQQAQSIEQHRAHFGPRPKFNWQFWAILTLLIAILMALLSVAYLLWQRRGQSTDGDSHEKN